jgi:AcrR family transcriptional regulator
MPKLTETMARRAVERSVADRQEAYAEEMQRIVDATYRLIERSGTVDPSLRDILRETKLSTQAFYRYFQSKDELFLLLLDDGRHQLLSYLEHRMAKAKSPAAKVRAWIEGVLAQAGQPGAAARTRPFVVNQARLIEAFPAEQQASVDLLVDQLATAVRTLPSRAAATKSDARRSADAIYELAFGRLHRHLIHRTKPTPAEVEHLVQFALNGAQQ